MAPTTPVTGRDFRRALRNGRVVATEGTIHDDDGDRYWAEVLYRQGDTRSVGTV